MGWEMTIPEANAGFGSGDGNGNFEIPEPGNHVAAFVGLIDLGSHEQSFEGNSTGYKRRVFLVWELLAENRKDGKPFFLGREFTLSDHEKSALRQWFEKWRCAKYKAGEKFDPSLALGNTCVLTVAHKSNRDGSRTYALVENIGAVPKGLAAPRKPSITPLAWQIPYAAEERAKATPPANEWLPFSYGQPLEALIRVSPEWNGGATAAAHAAPGGGDADDGPIPF